MGKDKKVIDLYGTRQNDNLKQNSYSKVLLEFITPFVDRFPEKYFVEDIYQFAVSVWNSCNLSKIVPDADEAIEEEEYATEPEKSIYEEMVLLKKNKFDDLDEFIMNFKVTPLKGDEIRLEVTTSTQEDFLDAFFESEAELFQDIFEADEGYIDRGALVLIPKKPFLDWVNSHSTENLPLEVVEPNVYLVEEEIGDWKDWLPKTYKFYFEQILFNWIIDEAYWPKKRTYSLFKQWFTIHFSDMVWDTVPEPIVKEDF